MSLVPSLTSPSYGASATSTGGAGASVKSSGVANAMSSTSATTTTASSTEPASSTTVTLSPQALGMSHASSAPSSSSASSTCSPPSSATDAAASDGPSIYDELKHGLAAAVGDVGDAITGTASWIGHGVESVVSGADTLVHGALDLPFAVVAEAANAAGAVLDAI